MNKLSSTIFLVLIATIFFLFSFWNSSTPDLPKKSIHPEVGGVRHDDTSTVGELPTDERAEISSQESEAELPDDGHIAHEAEPARQAPVDQSGLTEEEKIQQLLSAYDSWAKLDASASGEARVTAEVGLAGQCVVAILRSQGRADYGDPDELARRGGFSLKPRFPGELAFAADRARYSMTKGEFPAYDSALGRLKLDPLEVSGSATPKKLRDELETLYRTALQSLGVSGLEVPKPKGN